MGHTIELTQSPRLFYDSTSEILIVRPSNQYYFLQINIPYSFGIFRTPLTISFSKTSFKVCLPSFAMDDKVVKE